jgi:hypothetical protein
MPRSRTAWLAAAALSAALVLTGCSGGDSGGDSAQRQASIDSIMSTLTDDGSLSEEQSTCVRSGLEAYSDDELVILDTAERGADVPEELQERVIEMLNGCLLGE